MEVLLYRVGAGDGLITRPGTMSPLGCSDIWVNKKSYSAKSRDRSTIPSTLLPPGPLKLSQQCHLMMTWDHSSFCQTYWKNFEDKLVLLRLTTSLRILIDFPFRSILQLCLPRKSIPSKQSCTTSVATNTG